MNIQHHNKDTEEMRKEVATLINKVPDNGLLALKKIIESFIEYAEKHTIEMKTRALLAYMESVPEEDYELSEEERLSIAKGEEDVRAGRLHSWESVAEELEL